MHIIIDSDCDVVPSEAKPFVSEGNALLNLLLSLNYDRNDPPYADLLRSCHNLNGEWLIFSPVQWEATHNDAMIFALGSGLQLQEDIVKSWFNVFSEYWAEEGISLHYHDPVTWLMSHDKKYPLNAKPVSRLLNQSLMPELAQLDTTMYWQKFITECQMLFASKPNSSPMNGVWIWGGAKLKEKMSITICTDAHYMPLAKMCSNNVTLYSHATPLKDQHILLLTEFSMLSEHHQEELKKMPVHWYWNNTAYTIDSGRLIVSLWRKLIHAD
ncbi:MAG: hypothetical protein ACRCXC_03220 [Legionella sp.]